MTIFSLGDGFIYGDRSSGKRPFPIAPNLFYREPSDSSWHENTCSVVVALEIQRSGWPGEDHRSQELAKDRNHG